VFFDQVQRDRELADLALQGGDPSLVFRINPPLDLPRLDRPDGARRGAPPAMALST
jgi:hypothetical protein